MSTSSSTIRRSLGQYKARLLKQDNKLRGLVAQTIPTDSNECDDIKDEIELCCEEISKVITNIERRADEWQNLIDAIEDDGDREKESSLAEENASHADQGYLVATEVALETVQSAKLRIKQIQRAMQGRNTLSADRQDVSTTKATVKLPKIQLPHFNGDHLKWAEFWSIYEANVHSRELTGTEKFSYLLSLLTGKAKDTIDGLLVSDDNYDHAVSPLKQRFEKPPQDRITSLYTQLKKLTVSSRSNDEQRKTYDNCEKILRQLENAGENLDSNHSLVIEVLSKFPPSTIIYLQQHYKCGVNSDLPQLRNTLLKYLSEFESISETIENFKQPSNEPQTRPGSGGRYPGPNPQSGFNNPQFRFGGRNPVPPQPKGHTDFHRNPRAGPETTMTSFENQPSPCYFCKGSHFNCDCSQFPTTGERIRRLQELGCCTRSMFRGHTASNCQNEIWCYFCSEPRKHPSPLCPVEFSTKRDRDDQKSDPNRQSQGKGAPHRPPTPNPTKPEKPQPEVNMLNSNSNERSVLLTAQTIVANPVTGERVSARLIFDSASHRSYVIDSMANEINLFSQSNDDLRVAIFGSKKVLSIPSRGVELAISLRDGSQKLIQAHTTPIISESSVLNEHLSPDDRSFLRTMKYALADEVDRKQGQVEVPIGSDYFWEFITGAKMTTPSGLFVIPSSVGLLLAGRYEVASRHQDTNQFTLLCLTESTSTYPSEIGLIASIPRIVPKQLDVDEFWNLEAIGISDSPAEMDDEIAQKQFDDSIYYEKQEKRYQMAWPWKQGMQEKLPTNYPLALGRFKSLHKRLHGESDKQLLEAYQKTIDYQIDAGIIEKVPASQLTKPIGPVHYLPHHPVVKPSSGTTKVRIVYDASSKIGKNAVSLNECLYRGPVILPDLCEILLRFRTGKIAITSDIEKAFLQLGLRPEDREATRFLWYKDPNLASVENNLLSYRFCRVAFGVISSPFLLGATIQHHLAQISTPVAKKIVTNVYVDNVITSTDSVAEAQQIYTESKQIFSDAGMNIQQWSSNSKELMNIIPQADQISSPETNVLGLTWNVQNDTLRLSNKRWSNFSECNTKRQILAAVSSIFDPLGFYQPTVLLGKMYLQKLWIQNLQWDEPISDELKVEWIQIH